MQKWYIPLYELVGGSPRCAGRQRIGGAPQGCASEFRADLNLIKARGLERTHEPAVKHLDGRLWEMRLKGRDGIARAIYVVVHPRRIVVVRVFVKKTEKTPHREIELALQRVKEVRMSQRKFIPVEELFKEWRKDPEYVAAYDALEDEYALMEALMDARSKAGMTQADVARAMGTTQAAVARLESGRSLPSTRTLQRFADATGTRLRISFERPKSASRPRGRALKQIARAD